MPSSTSNSETAVAEPVVIETIELGAAPVRRDLVDPRRGLGRFVWRMGIFLGMQCVIAAAVLWPFVRQAPDTYMAELTDKHQRLAHAPSPRLILVGSSNLAFSFDSEMVRNQLHLEPVNLGLHQGLGFPWLLNVTVKNVRKGDVVLLAVEYLHFQYDSTTDTLPEAMMASPRATLDGMDYEVFKRTADQALALLGRRFRTLGLVAVGRMPFRPEQPYRHDAFNDLGDVVAHRTMTGSDRPTRRIGQVLKLNEIRFEYTVDRLNEFADQCRQRGATVFFTYAPYPQMEFERDREVINQMHARLENELQFPIISLPQESVYPVESFFDMEHHLMAAATAHRTQLVIQRLQGRLEGLALQRAASFSD